MSRARSRWMAAALMLVVAPAMAFQDTDKSPAKPSSNDKSLTSKAYVEKGMPSPDRIWNGGDMEAASKVILALSEEDGTKLPRIRSPKSGKVFTRIISREPLKMYRDRSFALETRFPDALQLMQSSNAILKAYALELQTSPERSAEVTELLCYEFDLVRAMFELVEELLPKLDKKSPTYPTRMNGLARMKSGFATMISGGLLSLTETHVYSLVERQKMLKSLNENVPFIAPWLTPDSKTELVVKIESMSKDRNLADIRPGLSQLLKATHAAVKIEK